MTELVPLSKIKDNPHRDKKRNPIDEERVESLVESIGTTGFWKGVYGRKVESYVEIAFGHNRVDAARKAGLKEIPIEIENLTDEDMLMRMTRENLRGEVLVAIEAVNATVKAVGVGSVRLEEVDKKSPKTSLRYAPSFIPGKECCTLDVQHPYNADTLARKMGGIYTRPNGRAQDTVLAALGVLEMEERKVTGFSDRTLKTSTEEGTRYLGAKKIIQLVNDVKQREVRITERREKTAEEAAEFDKEQRAIQAKLKAVADKAAEDRAKLVEEMAKAEVAAQKKKVKEIQAQIAEKEKYAVEKKLDLEVRAAELDKKVEQRKAQEAEAKKEDAYLPIKREAERILHKLEGDTSTTKEALVSEIKSLARQPLNNTDRERLRQAAITMGTFYTDWVSQQFLPPFSNNSKLNEYRSREAANRRAADAKAEREREKAERKVSKEKKVAQTKK